MFNDILFEVTYANGKWNGIGKEYNLMVNYYWKEII